ncbi:MAG: histidine ammonia-lyase, partial [Pseudomonadota bacterium]
NLSGIIGVEAICAVQGIEYRAPLVTSPALQLAMTAFRDHVPAIQEDRVLAGDIDTAAKLIIDDKLARAAEMELWL